MAGMSLALDLSLGRSSGGSGDPWAGAPLVFFDGDWGGDIDDQYAIAMLMQLHRTYQIKLEMVNVSCANTIPAAGLRVMLDWYALQWPAAKFDEIPVYSNQGATGGGSDNYATETRDLFGGKLEALDPVRYAGYATATRANFKMVTGQTSRTALDGWRKHLAAAADGTCRIITTGGFTSLSELLQSPADGFSALNGSDLLAAKAIATTPEGIAPVSSMDGSYPSTNNENNIKLDATAAAYVYANIPVDMNHNGTGFGVNCGPSMLVDQDLDPTRYGGDVYAGGNYYSKRPFDPGAVAIACADVLGLTLHDQGGGRGTNVVQSNVGGAGNEGNVWTLGGGGKHAFMQPDNHRTAIEACNAAIDALQVGKFTQANLSSFIFRCNEASGDILYDNADSLGRAHLGGRINDTAAGLAASTGKPTRGGTGYLDFDGGDFVAVAPPANGLFTSNNFVWSIVVELDSVTGERTFIARDYAATSRLASLAQSRTYGATGFMFEANGTALRVFTVPPSGSPASAQISKAVGLATATKYILTFAVVGGNQVSMWVNGSRVTTSYETLAIDGSVFTDDWVSIGALRHRTNGRGDPTSFLDGRVYNFGVAGGFTDTAGADAAAAALEASLRAYALSDHGVAVP